LCDTFGFTRHLVVENDDGTIAHAQLNYGKGMVMLGSVLDSPYGKLMRQPDEVGGGQTQSIYLVVPDPDAVFARARAAGAQIVLDLKDQD
ncbi:glyoxalase, partial [Acinetobacter baumannii]